MEKEPSRQSYQEYVEQITPKYNSPKNCIRAFLVGGVICTLGEIIKQIMMGSFHLKEDAAGNVVTLCLILLSVLATGLNFFPAIAKFGGAGCLVPITGFANSVVSPALEFKSEGFITGTAAKMFIIAGPVIVFGISASVIYGMILVLFGLA